MVEHLGGVVISRTRAVALCGRARLADIEIADGCQNDIVHAGPGGQMVFGEEAAADDAGPEGTRNQRSSSPGLVDLAGLAQRLAHRAGVEARSARPVENDFLAPRHEFDRLG